MLIETLSTNLTPALATNYSTSSYPAIVSTLTTPEPNYASPNGVVDLSFNNNIQGNFSQNSVVVVPFGVGSNTNTFNVRVVGWKRVPSPNVSGPGSPNFDLWVPLDLVEMICTIATAQPGVAGTLVPATNFFCTTIVVVTGSTLVGEAPSENIVSPGNGQIAHFLVQLKGCQKLQFFFTTGGSATSCNCLWSLQ
jgi:hypothetical protein